MAYTYKIINSTPKGNSGIITKVIYYYENIDYEMDIEHNVPESLNDVISLILQEGNNLLPTLQNLKNQADIIEQLNQMTDEQPI